MPRTSGRARTQTLTPAAIDAGAQDFITAGFNSFFAHDAGGTDGDGNEGTVVTLEWFDHSRDKQGSVPGATGQNHGHAEMDALHNLIAVHNKNYELLDTLSLILTCESKPCCVRCSSVLGHLGSHVSNDTKKVNKSMGSTQWGMSEDVVEYVAHRTGVDPRILRALGAVRI